MAGGTGTQNVGKVSKKQKAWASKLPQGKVYSLDEALKLVKEFATSKFNESVDAAVNLGIDASKSDQQVRGSTVMPNGIGKTVRVAVFTSGKNADAAKAAGADIVGLEDLAAKVKAGEMNFDVVVASPDAMRVVGQLGQILGPRGLMPNPKVGTVTPDVATAVKNAKAGQVRYRVDKAGIIHCTIGKASFETTALKENLQALISDLQKAKPATSKGVYLKRIALSSTMGPGVVVDQSSLASTATT
jgi:large subunit ribosomal protein L1